MNFWTIDAGKWSTDIADTKAIKIFDKSSELCEGIEQSQWLNICYLISFGERRPESVWGKIRKWISNRVLQFRDMCVCECRECVCIRGDGFRCIYAFEMLLLLAITRKCFWCHSRKAPARPTLSICKNFIHENAAFAYIATILSQSFSDFFPFACSLAQHSNPVNYHHH